jgi:hypothetical protein
MYSYENRLSALQKAAQPTSFSWFPKQQLWLHLLPSQYSANLGLVALFLTTPTNRKAKNSQAICRAIRAFLPANAIDQER